MTKDEIEFTLIFALPVPAIFGIIFTSFTTFVVLFFIFGFIASRYIINTRDKKEAVNVMKTNDTIYFMISDDDFAKVDVNNKDYKQVILDVLSFEIPRFKGLVDRVNFTNFQDDELLQKANSLLKTN